MRITKYIHSCLLVETDDRAVLIDPGSYTADADILKVEELPDLDAVLVTHGHFDHCNAALIRRIREQFPAVPVVSNQEAVDMLMAEDIAATTESIVGVTHEQAAHQPLPWRTPAPDNWSFTVFEQLTHSGDSLRITETAPVLALPVQAPWGSMREALDMALELRPEAIVPIHDWHWHETARLGLYQNAAAFFQKYGITFLQPENGQSVDI